MLDLERKDIKDQESIIVAERKENINVPCFTEIYPSFTFCENSTIGRTK